MDADEFRTMRSAAGLSVRGAAKALGAAPSTIQRWEAGASIPSDAAERIRELAGGLSENLATAATLGKLAAVLSYVIYGYAPPGDTRGSG